MASITKLYQKGIIHMDDDVDWVNDTIKTILVASSYTPNQATHEFYSDVTGELPTANGYTVGGVTLGTKTRTPVGIGYAYRAAAAQWTAPSGQTLSARYAVTFKSTGTAATSPLLCWTLLDTTPQDLVASNAILQVAWDVTDGVFKSLTS